MKKLKPVLVFVLLTFAWGSSYFFTAIALESFSSFLTVYIRIAIGAALLGILVGTLRVKLPPRGRVYAHFFVLGSISIALPFVLVTEAQQHVHSSMTAIMTSTSPLLVFLISWLWKRNEKLTLAKVVGLVLSFTGVVVLYGLQRGVEIDSSGWPLVVLLVAFLFAISNIYTQTYLAGIHPLVLGFLQVAAGWVLLTPAVFFTPLPGVLPSTASMLAVLQLGVVSSAAAYVMFAYLIQVWGSTSASMNTYGQPIVGVALGVLVLGEVLPQGAWFSVVLILIGVVVFGLGTYRSTTNRAAPSC